MNMFDYRLRPFLTDEEYDRMTEECQEIWREVDECTHANSVIRFKPDVGGHKRYYTQCLNCGTYRRVKQSEVKNPERATPVDEEKRSEYSQIRQEGKQDRVSRIYDKYNKLAEVKRDSSYQERYQDYQNYLLSDEWKRKRALVLKRANYMCEGCSINKATEVHHLTYDRLFDEMLFDLVAICSICHKKIHANKAA